MEMMCWLYIKWVFCSCDNRHRQIQDRFPPGCCKVSDPSGGCKGAEPLCIGKFGISELNLYNLVHTFDNSILPILLIISMYFFHYVKPMNMMKMGHFNLSFIVPLSPLTKAFFDKSGGGKAEVPGWGCKGAEPFCLGKFGISELSLRDLVHTF